MKHIKKVVTLALAFAMVLAMSAIVFAGTHEVSTESTTHTYEVYQIFTGTKSGDQLTNLKYGTNAKTGTSGSSVSAEDMAKLAAIEAKTYDNDQKKIDDLKQFVDLSTNPVATLGKDGNPSADLEEGYYIIKDKDGSLTNPETYTLYLFKVLDADLTITPKDGTTTVDKSVTETNDTAGTTTADQDGADYDVGDSIPYSLPIKFADNVTDYRFYEVTLTDTLSAGLTPPAEANIKWVLKDKDGNVLGNSEEDPALVFGTVEISVSGQAITAHYEMGVKTEGADAIKHTEGSAVLNNAVLTVSYEAVLNDNAVVGDAGNPNTYTITYSNNPNDTSAHGTTPPQDVKVYTYELEIEKKDGNGQPLQGAGFTLYKVVTEDFVGAQTGAAIKENLGTDVNASKLLDDGYYVPISMTQSVDGTTGKVTHKTDTKIDAGTYILIETTIPNGYNAYAGDTVVVTSTIDADGILTGLSATGPTGISADKTSGLVSAGVVNDSGAVLPTTGGIGTVIFYVLGLALIIGCGVVLVSRKRLQK